MMAVGVSCRGEFLRQVTTPEIVPNHMGDYLPTEAVALCTTLRKQFVE